MNNRQTPHPCAKPLFRSSLTRPSGSETGIKPSWVTCAPKTSNESFWIGRRDGKVKRSALSDRPRAQSQDGKYFYSGRTRLPPGLAWMLTVQAHHAPEAVQRRVSLVLVT